MSLLQPFGHDHVPLRKINPGDYSSSATGECVLSFSGWMKTPVEKNRVWLEADKFICLFICTSQDVLAETPLEKGVRKVINKHVGPFEGNWDPQDLSPTSRSSLDLIVHKDRTGQEPFQGQYLWDKFTPKERLYMEKRGLVAPTQ